MNFHWQNLLFALYTLELLSGEMFIDPPYFYSLKASHIYPRLVVSRTYFVVVVCRCVVVSLPRLALSLSPKYIITSSSEMVTIEITGRPKGISLRFLSAGGANSH